MKMNEKLIYKLLLNMESRCILEDPREVLEFRWTILKVKSLRMLKNLVDPLGLKYPIESVDWLFHKSRNHERQHAKCYESRLGGYAYMWQKEI